MTDWKPRLAPWLAAAAVFLLYLPSVRNGFVYDDKVLIQDQAVPAGIGDYARLFAERHFPTVPYYRPVVRLTYVVQKRLHGLDPAPYHLFNALLAALLAVAAARLMRGPALGLPAGPAALAALVWAAHPALSSCVYPISSGRETLMPSLFMLLAADAWFRPGRRWSAAAIGWFALALFSKEQAVALPAVFLVGDLLDLGGTRRFRRPAAWLWRYGALAVLGVGYLAIRRALFGGSEFAVAVWDAPWMPLFAYVYAMQTFFAPFRALVYEPPVAVWWSAWRAALGVALTVGAGVWAWRTGWKRAVLFWAAWFVLIQAPTAHLLEQEAAFDERYAALALLALPALAAAALARSVGAGPRRRAAAAAVLLLALGWGAVSAGRARYFRDDETFITQWMRTNPDSVDAMVNDGKYRIDHGDFAGARTVLERAVTRGPAVAHAWYNLGLALYHLADKEAAVACYRRALELDLDYDAHYNLALALADLGQPDEALNHYRLAVARNPAHVDALYNLGLLLARLARPEEALPFFARAAELAPGDEEPPYNRGVALERLGRPAEARAAYDEALKRNPLHGGAAFNLGMMAFRAGRFAEAARRFEQALRADPSDNEARQFLRAALDSATRAGQDNLFDINPGEGAQP